jgi:hypothetical protein
MKRAIGRVVLASLCLAAVPGCSAGPVVDSLPSAIGLPAGAPERPAVPHEYPPVHDMPPPRAGRPLSDAEQWQLEQELMAVRNRQAGAPDKKSAKPAKKKRPAGGQNTGTAGAKTNP